MGKSINRLKSQNLPSIQRLLGPLLLAAFALLAACSRSGPGLDLYLRSNEAALDRPASVDSRPVRFVVEPGTPARAVGQNLEQAGIIRDAILFESFVRANGLDSRLGAGTYTLTPSMTLREVVDTMTRPQAAAVSVTIREGWRLEQIADYLSRRGLLGPEEAERYRAIAAAGDLRELDASRYPF